MKEISIFIPTHDLVQVTEILRKHNVGGITFYEINGAGRTKRDNIHENVDSYITEKQLSLIMLKEQRLRQLCLTLQ